MSETPDFDLFGSDTDESRPSADAALAALLEAGPEAAEHLLTAAHELLMAAKAVVDAGERALEAHRAASGAGVTTASAGPAPEESPREPARRVRRIDLA